MTPTPICLSNGTQSHLLDSDEADALVAQLLGYGHDEKRVAKKDGCVIVQMPFDECLLQFSHGKIVLHGDISNDAVAAAMRHAFEAWGRQVFVTGDENFKLSCWAHAHIAGVAVRNYSPSRAQWSNANNLIGQYSVDLFNRNMDGRSNTLDGPIDKRRWGYQRYFSPEQLRHMEQVERAMGMTRNDGPTI